MTNSSLNWLNVPNGLSIFRLVGTPFLFVLVQYENPAFFITWFIILGFTDFLDGKLARAWNQVSELGAHLDTAADVVYYLSTAWFLYTLFPTYLEPNLLYLQLFLGILAFTFMLSLVMFRKVLFLHTHLSRLSGVLVFAAFLLSFVLDTTHFIFLVILLYSLAFVEFILIYFIRGDVSPDTRTVFRKKKVE